MYKTHKNYKYVQLEHKCILFFKDGAKINNGPLGSFENESRVFIPDGFIADDPLMDNLVYILDRIGCGSIIWIKGLTADPEYSFIKFINQNNNDEILVKECDISVGEYTLAFAQNTKVLYKDGKITFAASAGRSVLTMAKGDIGFNAVSAHLDLTGELAGSIVFSLSKTSGLLDALNPGFEYAIDSGRYIHYPLFKKGQAASVSAVVNPCSPLNERATFFTLETEAPLVTNFNSIFGHEVAISPAEERNLVFEQKVDTLYIGPCGRYSIAGGDGTIMLDFGGREYFTYKKGGDSIIFHPHYASSIAVRGMPERSGKPARNDAFTAAWAELPAGTKHTRINKSPANTFEKGGLNANETTLEDCLTVPVVPYCGIGVALQKKFIETMDKGISNLRNNEIILKGAGHEERAAQKGTATCSNGLMHKINAWDRLYLANTNTAQSEDPNVYISGHCESLKNILNQQDIFIYYTEPDISDSSSDEAITKALFVDECRVETGAFDFVLKEPVNGAGTGSGSSWRSSGTTRTAFLFKRRHTGNSILELMNGNGQSHRNHAVFQAAYRRALDGNGNPRKGFEHFINTINDPGFEGTIILNCPVQAKSIPDKLSLIVDSMDPEKIYAHHLILPLGELSSEQGVCRMSRSPVFSVALYEPDSMIVNAEETDEAGFVTNNAVICMKNGAASEDAGVDMIYCACELMVNRLFGSSCGVEGAKSGNCMLLDGVYQSGGGLHNYSFTLRNPVSYRLDSSAISSLSVESVQYSFDTKGMTGTFTLSGKLDFINPDGCDLFSYGSSGQDGVEGLAYHGLQIAIGSDMRLSVLYDSISFDIKDSAIRPNSFKDRFVCEFEKMVSGNGGATPESMGYGSITCPVKQGKLSGSWYGLVWKIHLGDFGSEQKGVPLDIRLLTAWSPGGESGGPMLFIGMQLPMGLNTEGLDIMGILNLGFNSIELIARDNEENGKRDYILQLHHFALKLLGISLPPGSNDIFIFSDGESLGWYAGYLK